MAKANLTRKRIISASEKLPSGCYVAKITGARFEVSDDLSKYPDKIVLAYDIAEGEYKDFFKNQFDANTNEDKKWKGVIKLGFPNENTAEYVADKLNDFDVCLEESNAGYTWDGDSDHIKEWVGKLIGVGIRDTAGDINGKRFNWTEYAKPFTIAEVRNGKAKTPKFYARDGKGRAVSVDPVNASVDKDEFMKVPDTIEEEIPF